MKKWKKAFCRGQSRRRLVFALAGCGSEKDEGKDAKKITVGTSNFTEAIILGNIYSELIEANTDYEVERRFNLAGAAVCFDALLNDDIDMFVEYTGTASYEPSGSAYEYGQRRRMAGLYMIKC